MHPPLERPHPKCQKEIEEIKNCHDTNSKLKFWACNDFKYALDRCFKAEKNEILKKVNLNLDDKWKKEEQAFMEAMGHKNSFEEYLNKDAEYLKERELAKGRKMKGSS